MQRLMMAFAAVLALTFAAGTVVAQEKEGEKKEERKDERKDEKRRYSKKKSGFKPLGKNVTLEFIAKGDGGDVVAEVSTASNRYEVSVERTGGRNLHADGVISIPDEGGYLVSYNLAVSRPMRTDDGWDNVTLFIKGSALVKAGKTITLGKSKDYSISLKLDD
jgi:hypothetical protein